MKRTIIYLITLVTTICCTTSLAFAQHDEWIHIAPITPKSLNRFVNQSGLFKAAKAPTMHQTILQSVDTNASEYYSTYTMQPLQVIGKVTRYKTTEHVEDGQRFTGISNGQEAIVHGQGLSLGGIFWPKESMKVYGPHRHLVYNNLIDITAIKPVSGHLFPLKVGNELVFDFKREHTRMLHGHTTVKMETGRMTYKVTSVRKQFPYSEKSVPGPIYQIEVWESTNLHPKPFLTDIYEYSAGFNWYVSDKYYTRENRLIAWYRVKDWS